MNEPADVRLRPPTEADAAFLRRIESPEVAGPFNHFDDPPAERITSADVGAGSLVVVLADGTPGGLPVGDVSWFGVPYGPNRRSLAWRIGCTVDVPYRGRGIGSRAQRLLAEHLFASTPSNRVEADTSTENLAEQRALARAGFTCEGTVRGSQYRAGRWHDHVLFGLVRSDLGLGEPAAGPATGPRTDPATGPATGLLR